MFLCIVEVLKIQFLPLYLFQENSSWVGLKHSQMCWHLFFPTAAVHLQRRSLPPWRWTCYMWGCLLMERCLRLIISTNQPPPLTPLQIISKSHNQTAAAAVGPEACILWHVMVSRLWERHNKVSWFTREHKCQSQYKPFSFKCIESHWKSFLFFICIDLWSHRMM